MIRYQQGEERAFNLLYDRYNGRIYGYLKRRLQSVWADDVFQQVFIKLHRTRHQYNPQYQFSHWIFVLTKTVLLDFWKTTGVQTQRYFSQNFETTTNADANENVTAPIEPPRGRALPEQMLAGISGNQRAAVELRFVDELSYREIAERLKSTEASSRQWVSRALKTIRNRMEKPGSSR